MEDGVQAGNEFFLKLSESQEVDDLAGEKFYKYMSQCVGSERKRIGGNWAVAQAVPTKNLRDAIRKTLGNDKVTFILLNLEKETARERLAQRHGETETGKAEAEFMMKIQEFYETITHFQSKYKTFRKYISNSSNIRETKRQSLNYK